jgi:glycosyltransferase involved in cell wall biosynthesis
MRITFVSPTVNMGGGTRVMVIYARLLQQRGHSVCIVSPPPRPIPLRRQLRSLLGGRGWPKAPRSVPSHLDGSGVTHRVLERWQPIVDRDVPDADVVIATWWETAEWVNALSSRKGAKAYFIQHHEVFGYLPVDRCRATYRLPLHKIVIARWLKDLMARDYGDPTVDVVPNAVDHGQFFAAPRGKQGQPTVGLLYTNVPFKGLDVALLAVERVRGRFPELRLVAFGAEPPAPQRPLPPRTDFVYLPAQDKLRELYARCDVWLTASRNEGFNLPAMEAMACRTPVVATRTGWPEEAIIDGENGMLAGIDDVDALAAGLEAVLGSSDEQWRRLSENARRTVATASWDASAMLFERALQHARERAARGEIPRRSLAAVS